MKRRIAVLGKNNLAVEVTEALLANPRVDLRFVVPNRGDSGQDGWQRSLRGLADRHGLRVVDYPARENQEWLDTLAAEELDFMFSLQFDRIIRPATIAAPRHGIMNLHFSPLPRYRGVAPIALAMMRGETTHGVSLHYVDPGVDTGDLVAQDIFSIDELHNARQLYDRCVERGVALFRQKLDDILELRTTRSPQNHALGLYFCNGSIDFSQTEVNWNASALAVTNWIRAMIFEPFQFPTFTQGDQRLEIFAVGADFRRNQNEKPGTVVERVGDGYRIATHDCYVTVRARPTSS